jgi:hypothetical protein
MAIRTIYKCDCCGHEQDNNDQMWCVELFVSHYPGRGYGTSYPAVRVLWCRKCINKFALLDRLAEHSLNKQPEPHESQRPTIEDIFREIAREEAAVVVGERIQS